MTRNEYATFLYYFGTRYQSKEEQAILIPDALSALQNSEWAQGEGLDLAIAGAVMAFWERYPDRKHRWQADYPELRHRVERAVMQSKENPDWADYHMSRWFVLRQESSLDAILNMIADGGNCGRVVRLKLQGKTVAECVPFQKSMRKARRAREASMLIQ